MNDLAIFHHMPRFRMDGIKKPGSLMKTWIDKVKKKFGFEIWFL